MRTHVDDDAVELVTNVVEIGDLGLDFALL